MSEEQSVETIHLSDYLHVVLKHKKLIIVFLAVTVVLAMGFTLTRPAIYGTSAQVVIDKEKTASPLTGYRTEIPTYMDQQLTFNTHFELIRSKPVILKVIEDLKLDEPGAFGPQEEPSTLARIKNQIKKNIRLVKNTIKSALGKEAPELSDEEKLDGLVKSIQASIKVTQVPETRLFVISVKSLSPIMATKIANSVAKNYIEFDMETRLSSSKDSIEWMNNEMYRVKKRLEDDEKKFHEYKQLNKLFSVEGKQKVISQKIQEFNNEYLSARNKRLELEAQLEQITKMKAGGSDDIVHVRSIVNNPAIDSIYKNLTDLELERTRLSKVYKSKHPKIVQNNSEIERNKVKLKSELEKEIDNLKTERSVLLAKEQVMEQNISEFEKDALEESGKELRYTILQRNLETSQNLYNTLVAKVKESGVLSSGASSNVRIVEKAVVPLYPVGPNKKKNLLLAVVLGLFGGVGIAFFLEYIDQSIKTEEDAERYLDLPVLAIIPTAETPEG